MGLTPNSASPILCQNVRSLRKQLELVAYAPDRFEHPLVGDALQLLAQTLYVNVNGS